MRYFLSAVSAFGLLATVSSQRTGVNVNYVHYTPIKGWVGPVDGILETRSDRQLHVYVGLPIEDGKRSPLKWGAISSSDLLTWEDRDAFAVSKSGASYLQGVMMPNPFQNDTKVFGTEKYLAIFPRASSADPLNPKLSIQTSTNAVTAHAVKAATIANFPAYGVDSFYASSDQSIKYFFLAVLYDSTCNISFHQLSPQARRVGIFYTNMRSKSQYCDSVSVRRLGSNNNAPYIVAVTVDDSDAHSKYTQYWIGTFSVTSDSLTFKPSTTPGSTGKMDYGTDAHSFRFGMYEGSLVAIGRNTNYRDNYPDGLPNGLTVARKLSSFNGLAQQPIDLSPYYLGKSTYGTNKKLTTSTCSYRHTFSSLSNIAGAYFFDLTFAMDTTSAGFKIEFQSSASPTEILAVVLSKKVLKVDRRSTAYTISGDPTSASASIEPFPTFHLKIILDKSTIEVFAESTAGTIVLTQSFTTKNPLERACFQLLGGTVSLQGSSTYAKVASIWGPKPTPRPGSAVYASGITSVLIAVVSVLALAQV